MFVLALICPSHFPSRNSWRRGGGVWRYCPDDVFRTVLPFAIKPGMTVPRHELECDAKGLACYACSELLNPPSTIVCSLSSVLPSLRIRLGIITSQSAARKVGNAIFNVKIRCVSSSNRTYLWNSFATRVDSLVYGR